MWTFSLRTSFYSKKYITTIYIWLSTVTIPALSASTKSLERQALTHAHISSARVVSTSGTKSRAAVLFVKNNSRRWPKWDHQQRYQNLKHQKRSIKTGVSRELRDVQGDFKWKRIHRWWRSNCLGCLRTSRQEVGRIGCWHFWVWCRTWSSKNDS